MDFSGSWDRYIPLMEFAYNNSFQSSIGMAPYEALYGRKCRTPMCWTELNEHKLIGPDIVKDTEEKVQVIRQRLKAASDRRKSYANLKKRDIEYNVGDKVFLKVSPWRKILRFSQKGDFETYWPCVLSSGTPSGVSQITRCVSCVDASEIPL